MAAACSTAAWTAYANAYLYGSSLLNSCMDHLHKRTFTWQQLVEQLNHLLQMYIYMAAAYSTAGPPAPMFIYMAAACSTAGPAAPMFIYMAAACSTVEPPVQTYIYMAAACSTAGPPAQTHIYMAAGC